LSGKRCRAVDGNRRCRRCGFRQVITRDSDQHHDDHAKQDEKACCAPARFILGRKSGCRSCVGLLDGHAALGGKPVSLRHRHIALGSCLDRSPNRRVTDDGMGRGGIDCLIPLGRCGCGDIQRRIALSLRYGRRSV
jgi:hypothetical protein